MCPEDCNREGKKLQNNGTAQAPEERYDLLADRFLLVCENYRTTNVTCALRDVGINSVNPLLLAELLAQFVEEPHTKYGHQKLAN